MKVNVSKRRTRDPYHHQTRKVHHTRAVVEARFTREENHTVTTLRQDAHDPPGQLPMTVAYLVFEITQVLQVGTRAPAVGHELWTERRALDLKPVERVPSPVVLCAGEGEQWHLVGDADVRTAGYGVTSTENHLKKPSGRAVRSNEDTSQDEDLVENLLEEAK